MNIELLFFASLRDGVGPVKAADERDGLRFDNLDALQPQHEGSHEQQEGDIGRDRVAGQADEMGEAAGNGSARAFGP